MKLLNLTASRYRSLRDETIPLTDLNLFIGANASGKSTVLDALRFLHEGVQKRDFADPMFTRGGIVHLAWKGEEAREIQLLVRIEDQGAEYEWLVGLSRDGYGFAVHEQVREFRPNAPPTELLHADRGTGRWWSGEKGEVSLAQAPTTCALAAAAADAAFPARAVAQFISRWGFFDPNPFLLRRSWAGLDSTTFDSSGRNLADRLHVLFETARPTFDRIISATQSVLGLPSRIELRELEDRISFVQFEPGLRYPVHQMGASSGTLRMLALMTALFGESESNLIGIEEPENHIHPSALESFAQYLREARHQVQILVTTHSPLLLDFLDDPEAVCIVRHSDLDGTQVTRESNVSAVREALDASGFGLGEFYETKGFGG